MAFPRVISNQKGVTFIELIMSMFLVSTVLVGLLSILSNAHFHSTEMDYRIRLQQIATNQLETYKQQYINHGRPYSLSDMNKPELLYSYSHELNRIYLGQVTLEEIETNKGYQLVKIRSTLKPLQSTNLNDVIEVEQYVSSR